MKLATSAAPVEVSGGSANSSFSIAMNGKAFRVLSDTLYQNKIGSIVREVSCNAYDAHIMAGKADVPFVIHLPDAFEPWFAVQDFGVGLSPEDMVSVFTVYFQSTKDNSNDAVGAFGLGAKTPFSYTDQFTVTSVKDGVRRIYSAYITETGVPSIVEMDCASTTDINGVEIKMSVKREDYNTFANEVADQLKFFKVKPAIQNRANFVFKSTHNGKAEIATSNFAMYGSASYGQNWATIIQGNVGYPLDYNQVKSKVNADNQRFLDIIRGTELHLFFDIGQIGVTASREGVEYNAYTVANIDAKLDAVRAEMNAYVSSKLASLKTAWEKALFLNDSVNLNRVARAAGVDLDGQAKFSGSYYFDMASALMDDATDGTKNKVHNSSVKYWNPGKTTRDWNASYSVQPRSDRMPVIVFRDTKLKPNVRAKHYLSTLGSRFYLIEIEKGDGVYDDAFVKRITTALGGYDKIIRLSDIEPPARESTAKGDKVRANYSRPTYYSFNGSDGKDGNIRSWDREFEAISDIEDEMLYVEIEDMAIVDSKDVIAFRKYNALSAIQDVLPVIGIRVGDAKKREGNANLIPLQTYVEKAIAELESVAKYRLMHKRLTLRFAMDYHVEPHFRQKDLYDVLALKLPNHKITRFLRMYHYPEITHAERTRVLNVAELLGWKEYDYNSRVEKLVDEMFSSYKFLHLYDEWAARRHITPHDFARYLAAD